MGSKLDMLLNTVSKLADQMGQLQRRGDEHMIAMTELQEEMKLVRNQG